MTAPINTVRNSVVADKLRVAENFLECIAESYPGVREERHGIVTTYCYFCGHGTEEQHGKDCLYIAIKDFLGTAGEDPDNKNDGKEVGLIAIPLERLQKMEAELERGLRPIAIPLERLQKIEAELERGLRPLVHFGPNIDTQAMALDALKIKDVSISSSLQLLREITGKYE